MASGGLRVDGVDVLSLTTTETYAEYSVELELSAGEVELAVFFENDSLCDGQGDRNFYIDWLALEGLTWLGESTAGEAEARAWIADMGGRAHRRPLSEDQVDAYYALFLQGPDLVGSGDDFADGVRLVMGAMLQSPWFLYRTELGTELDDSGGIPLDGYELAAKLSFALWNAPPDDTLWAAADTLTDPEVLREQARRLLADPRAEAVLDDFHGQLYNLDATGDLVREDFEGWEDGMGADLREETERFLRTLILEEQGGVHELYGASWSMLNPRLAGLYGVSGPEEGWAQVELPPEQRAGLLTQGSFLAPRADSHDPSPIQRGVFINRTVLCQDLPDPPDNATGLPPLQEGATNRERVEAHTGEGTCGGSCHAYLINPPGFAFENYDAVGAWRVSDNGQPVDASGEFYFSDGPASWTTGPELAGLIAGHPDAHGCYAWRWLSWTHARPPTEADRERIAPLVQASVEGLPITELLVELVASESFRYRAAEEAE
ncbi:MAG: DUF1592 domain-containing protein [Alphaproteobacteria bacterium]|nr:DUF1592 domain-containing protein [Alphaproteobacteria bacterium]